MTLIGTAFIFFFSITAAWLLLLHYHSNVLMPDIRRFIYQQKRDEREWATNLFESYHEDKLLPTVTLLASQRFSVNPPPAPVEDELPRRRVRQQISEDAIENIWDKVKASY